MNIPKIFFIFALITSTYSLQTMNFDSLSSPKNDDIILRLIKNTETHKEDISSMINNAKALSLTNWKLYKTLNSSLFTDMFIKSLSYWLGFNTLYVANQVNTAGGKTWVNQYLKDSNFH